MNGDDEPLALARDNRVQSVSLRDSVEGDIPAICAIYAADVLRGTGTFEETAPDEEEMVRRRAAILEKELPYLVASLDDQVLAFAYAAPFRTRSGYRYTVENSVVRCSIA